MIAETQAIIDRFNMRQYEKMRGLGAVAWWGEIQSRELTGLGDTQLGEYTDDPAEYIIQGPRISIGGFRFVRDVQPVRDFTEKDIDRVQGQTHEIELSVLSPLDNDDTSWREHEDAFVVIDMDYPDECLFEAFKYWLALKRAGGERRMALAVEGGYQPKQATLDSWADQRILWLIDLRRVERIRNIQFSREQKSKKLGCSIRSLDRREQLVDSLLSGDLREWLELVSRAEVWEKRFLDSEGSK